MKKRILCLIPFVLLSLFFAGCCSSHEWAEATCTAPKTCTRCGATEGTSLEHSWLDATCKNPKTCATCGTTLGDALGHIKGEWKIVTEPEDFIAGTKSRNCTICDDVLDTEEFFYPYFNMSFEEFMKKHNNTYSSQGWKIKEVSSGFEFYIDGEQTAIIFHNNLNYLGNRDAGAFSTKKWDEFNIIQVRVVDYRAGSIDTDAFSTISMLGAAITQPLFNYDLNDFLEEFVDTWVVSVSTQSYIEGSAIINGCKYTMRAYVSDFTSSVYYEWECQTT